MHNLMLFKWKFQYYLTQVVTISLELVKIHHRVLFIFRHKVEVDRTRQRVCDQPTLCLGVSKTENKVRLLLSHDA